MKGRKGIPIESEDADESSPSAEGMRKGIQRIESVEKLNQKVKK